jgi:hypothetical protein
MWKVDVIPVLQGEIGRFKDEPDENRPWDHQKEFFSPVHEKRIAFQTVDDRVNEEDIRPPGKTVEPTVKRLDLPKMKDFRDDEEEKTDDSVKGKRNFHKIQFITSLFSKQSKPYPQIQI